MSGWSLPNPVSQTLLLSNTLSDPQGSLLFSVDINGQSIPRFTIQSSKSTKPQLQISRAAFAYGNQQGALIGTVSLHSLSSSIDVLLNGHEVHLKHDGLSDYHSWTHPVMGKLKWKTDSWSGKGLKLMADNGTLLAACKGGSSSTQGNNGSIEIVVPGDEFFVEMVVVTGLAVMRYRAKELKQVKQAADGVDIVSTLLGG